MLELTIYHIRGEHAIHYITDEGTQFYKYVFFAILNFIAIRNVISLKHNSMALIRYHFKDDNMVKMLYYLKHNDMVKMLYVVKLSIIVWWF